MEAHEVRDGRVQEPSLRGREERDEDVRPREWPEEGSGAVCY